MHRSGRTARAGESGTVVSLLEGSQKKDARKLQRAIGLDEPITDPDIAALIDPPISMRIAEVGAATAKQSRAPSASLRRPSVNAKRDDRSDTERTPPRSPHPT